MLISSNLCIKSGYFLKNLLAKLCTTDILLIINLMGESFLKGSVKKATSAMIQIPCNLAFPYQLFVDAAHKS